MKVLHQKTSLTKSCLVQVIKFSKLKVGDLKQVYDVTQKLMYNVPQWFTINMTDILACWNTKYINRTITLSEPKDSLKIICSVVEN